MELSHSSALAKPFALDSQRKRCCAALLSACAIAGVVWLWQFNNLSDHSRVVHALLAGTIAAGATALGTLPILFARVISDRVKGTLLGFGAGVMLAATAFSLIIPALQAAATGGAGRWHAGVLVSTAMILGAALLLALDAFMPVHRSPFRGDGRSAVSMRRAWLFVFAISLHNIPEGLAIGVGYAGIGHAGATALATGIAVQDLPEGLVISLALLGAGYRRGFAMAMGALSGLVEPIGAVVGAALIGVSATLLPWGLALSAGAMLYVINHDVVPEAHSHSHGRFATGALMLGFVLMMLLDTTLK